MSVDQFNHLTLFSASELRGKLQVDDYLIFLYSLHTPVLCLVTKVNEFGFSYEYYSDEGIESEFVSWLGGGDFAHIKQENFIAALEKHE